MIDLIERQHSIERLLDWASGPDCLIMSILAFLNKNWSWHFKNSKIKENFRYPGINTGTEVWRARYNVGIQCSLQANLKNWGSDIYFDHIQHFRPFFFFFSFHPISSLQTSRPIKSWGKKRSLGLAALHFSWWRWCMQWGVAGNWRNNFVFNTVNTQFSLMVFLNNSIAWERPECKRQLC